MSLFCEAVLINRQNLYKTYMNDTNGTMRKKDALKGSLISLSADNEALSGSQLRQFIQSKGVNIGRDAFYKLVKELHLTLNSRKKAWKKQHNSRLPVKNLIMNHTYHRVFEVLFSDYTQIATCEGKLELLLIEDLVSRAIVSYRISNTCTSAPVIEALEESLALKAFFKLRYRTIFHSDKGSEFVNHALRKVAQENNVLVSNTGKGHCYENAFLESLNRTLKHSLGLRKKFKTKREATVTINSVITFYNNEHRHSNIGKRTPYSVLMSYTGKKSKIPDGKERVATTSTKVPRIYSNSLAVKIKPIHINGREMYKNH